MIRIDWAQIKSLHDNLLQKGFTKETPVIIMIFYRGSRGINDCEKSAIKLGKLYTVLSVAENDPAVSSICVFDSEAKRALWRVMEAIGFGDKIEAVPHSGHASIIRDFNQMSPEQKDVWLDITVASIMQHIASKEV